MNKSKRSLLLSSVVILLASGHLFSQTQSDTNQDACTRYKNADAEMNRLYRQVLSSYKSDAVFTRKLRIAQRAWTQFRDAHLESLYPRRDKLSAYGSAHPMCRCLALAELTDERARELKKWVTGAEEGDVCSGSTKK